MSETLPYGSEMNYPDHAVDSWEGCEDQWAPAVRIIQNDVDVMVYRNTETGRVTVQVETWGNEPHGNLGAVMLNDEDLFDRDAEEES